MRARRDPEVLEPRGQLGLQRVRGLRKQEEQVRCPLGGCHEAEGSKMVRHEMISPRTNRKFRLSAEAAAQRLHVGDVALGGVVEHAARAQRAEALVVGGDRRRLVAAGLVEQAASGTARRRSRCRRPSTG